MNLRRDWTLHHAIDTSVERQVRRATNPYSANLIRRAEPAAEQILSQRLAAIGEKKVAIRDAIQSLPKGSAEIDKQERLLEELNQDLELVTALRRTKKQPDPLAVIIDLPKDLEAWNSNFPHSKSCSKMSMRTNASYGFRTAVIIDRAVMHDGEFTSGTQSIIRSSVVRATAVQCPRWSSATFTSCLTRITWTIFVATTLEFLVQARQCHALEQIRGYTSSLVRSVIHREAVPRVI